jgi:PTS system glucose-specific IIA component
MVGPGVAVDPDRASATVVAPISGRALKVMPHAFVLVAADGAGILVHLGIDTVQLEGAGFEGLVEQGATVDAGTPMVRWDPAAVERGGRSPVVPVCVMDAPKGAVSSPLAGERCSMGEVLFAWPAG